VTLDGRVDRAHVIDMFMRYDNACQAIGDAQIAHRTLHRTNTHAAVEQECDRPCIDEERVARAT
jgi:hypothetical protein